jgi:hypothetical protein
MEKLWERVKDEFLPWTLMLELVLDWVMGSERLWLFIILKTSLVKIDCFISINSNLISIIENRSMYFDHMLLLYIKTLLHATNQLINLLNASVLQCCARFWRTWKKSKGNLETNFRDTSHVLALVTKSDFLHISLLTPYMSSLGLRSLFPFYRNGNWGSGHWVEKGSNSWAGLLFYQLRIF